MRNTRMMIRFLDLTLLLLMGFLLQADLAIEREVGLPYGDEAEGGEVPDVLRLNLGVQSWWVEGQGVPICEGKDSEELRSCLSDSTTPETSVLITPEPGVRVQNLVDALDVCASINVSCAPSAWEQN